MFRLEPPPLHVPRQPALAPTPLPVMQAHALELLQPYMLRVLHCIVALTGVDMNPRAATVFITGWGGGLLATFRTQPVVRPCQRRSPCCYCLTARRPPPFTVAGAESFLSDREDTGLIVNAWPVAALTRGI